MPQCVRVLPVETPFARNLDGGENFTTMYPMVVVDPSCSTDLRIFTTQEISSPGGSAGVNLPDPVLMRESFFMSFGLVISCWILGKFVGAVLELIKGKQNDY
ncbi:MAG: hypothetical protein QE488_06910 [Acidovorax sp.]|nr:hypothetical protein [Acidovorax sp.]